MKNENGMILEETFFFGVTQVTLTNPNSFFQIRSTKIHLISLRKEIINYSTILSIVWPQLVEISFAVKG